MRFSIDDLVEKCFFCSKSLIGQWLCVCITYSKWDEKTGQAAGMYASTSCPFCKEEIELLVKELE